MCVPPKAGCIWPVYSISIHALSLVGRSALMYSTLNRAVACRQPKEQLLLYSDHGSQYWAHGYQSLLRRHRIVPSHPPPGNCWDNAAMISFFRSLKAERVYVTRYTKYQEAKADLFYCISS
ncbi:DDE-type integrase/transposase/recombinase [Pseudomonas sp. D8002]|nr:DDE-type integrase/transposase/recombinase [Pseudomonas sp. D8002]NWB20987.1 DDE-type integrase/transposase/recombinase [Pseudomonas sp. D4002]